MKPKVYFAEMIDEEFCYPMEVIRERMIEDRISSCTVFEAKPDKSSDYFFCKAVGECTEQDGETCGKNCEDYEPCNGKSGKCKHKGYCYEPTGNEILVTVEIKEE